MSIEFQVQLYRRCPVLTKPLLGPDWIGCQTRTRACLIVPMFLTVTEHVSPLEVPLV